MKCYICGKEFNKVSNESRHFHYRYARNMILCEDCIKFYNEHKVDINYKCPVCGKEFAWYNGLKYRTYEELSIIGQVVCKSCYIKQGYKKRDETMMERYGVSNPSQSKEVQEKRKQTNLERYGVENASQAKEVIEKRTQTFLRRYGVTSPGKLDSVQEKMKSTNLERYGVECTLSSPEFQERIRQTNLEKYGVENVSQSEEVKAKIKQTFIDHFGVDNPMQVQKVKDKVKATMFDRYGVEYALQNETSKEKFKQTSLQHFGVENPLSSKEVQEKRKQTNLRRYGVEHTLSSKEVRDKSKQTLIRKYGVDQIMYSEEIRDKVAKSSRMSKLEKKVAELLKNREIPFKSQFTVKQNGHIHTFDFAIYSSDGTLTALIDTDGLFYHAYLGDADGKHQRDDYDFIRTYCIPENVKFIVIYEQHLDEGISELMKCLDVDYNEYLKNIFEWCRSIEFPYYKYDEHSLRISYDKLCNYESFSYYGNIGGRIIRHFHKSILHSYRKGSLSPYNAYHNDELLMKVIKNRFIYVNNLEPARILEGFNISKLAPKVSVFKPTRAKTLVQKYLSEYHEVFDPFSGFSGRMLGVCASGKKYIGQDINQQIVNESNEIIEFLNLDASITQQDILSSSGEYECLFTCSPYSDKEIWSNESVFKTCDEWIDECLSRFKCNAYLFVVDNTEKYKNHIIEEIENKSHFGKNKEYVVLIKHTGIIK